MVQQRYRTSQVATGRDSDVTGCDRKSQRWDRGVTERYKTSQQRYMGSQGVTGRYLPLTLLFSDVTEGYSNNTETLREATATLQGVAEITKYGEQQSNNVKHLS